LSAPALALVLVDRTGRPARTSDADDRHGTT
jgi:hypothetical protein